MKNNFFVVCSLILGAVLAVSAADNFVISKKEVAKSPKAPRPSPSRLKEDIGGSYARILKRQSSIMERMARSNAVLVDRARDLLDDDEAATLDQLKKYKAELAEAEKKLVAFEADVCAMFDCFNTGLSV